MVCGVDKDATFGEVGYSALHRAASLGHFESIQMLSAYGADFSLSTSTGENSMHMATKNCRLLCTRLLGQRGMHVADSVIRSIVNCVRKFLSVFLYSDARVSS